MRRLFGAADRCLKDCGWSDVALLKFSLCALGALVGLAVPAGKKRPAAWAAALVFVGTAIPLMAKFLSYLGWEEDGCDE